MRIEPAPSVACAIGTIPAATAAAAPPLEPPVLWARFHGLRVGPPYRTASVDGLIAISGVVVRPKITSPLRRWRATTSLSTSLVWPAKNREPQLIGKSRAAAVMSLRRNGTPSNAPPGRPAAIAFRATSSRMPHTALIAGLRAATRSSAASSSSPAETSRRFTSAARPSAS